MTICISAICENGTALVLAADSMITSPALSIQFEHAAKKMTRLSDRCIALTAGDALAHTELFNAVQWEVSNLKSPSIPAIVSMVKECYHKIREREIVERILAPRGFDSLEAFYSAHRVLLQELTFGIQAEIDSYNYGLDILVSGVDAIGAAHIHGIVNPGTSMCFDAIGFHAIGSGLPHAITTLIGRGCHQDTPLHEALLIVYEAKKAAEKAPGVGMQVTDICIITSEACRTLPVKKVDALEAVYEKWVTKDPGWAGDIGSLLQGLEGSE